MRNYILLEHTKFQNPEINNKEYTRKVLLMAKGKFRLLDNTDPRPTAYYILSFFSLEVNGLNEFDSHNSDQSRWESELSNGLYWPVIYFDISYQQNRLPFETIKNCRVPYCVPTLNYGKLSEGSSDLHSVLSSVYSA